MLISVVNPLGILLSGERELRLASTHSIVGSLSVLTR